MNRGSLGGFTLEQISKVLRALVTHKSVANLHTYIHIKVRKVKDNNKENLYRSFDF